MRRSLVAHGTAALIVYTIGAFLLYFPLRKCDHLSLRDAIVVSCIVASMGTFFLSRRWLNSFLASLFAGAIYGFGPFLLGLVRFHPTSHMMAAIVPWLLLPAAFGPTGKFRSTRILLGIMPFILLIVFFKIAAAVKLFPMPLTMKPSPDDLVGFIWPIIAAKKGWLMFSVYHVTLLPLLVGGAMLYAAKRWHVVFLVVDALVLSFLSPILDVSPAMWLSIPMVAFAILIGEGIQGLSLAGFRDRQWVLLGTFLLLTLSAVTFLFATKLAHIFAGFGMTYSKILLFEGKIYLLGAACGAAIFLLEWKKLRLREFRLVLILFVIAMDLLLSTRLVLEQIL